jgi:hypothetical protein
LEVLEVQLGYFLAATAHLDLPHPRHSLLRLLLIMVKTTAFLEASLERFLMVAACLNPPLHLPPHLLLIKVKTAGFPEVLLLVVEALPRRIVHLLLVRHPPVVVTVVVASVQVVVFNLAVKAVGAIPLRQVDCLLPLRLLYLH